MNTEVIIPRFFDAHVHLRHGQMLEIVLPHSAKWCHFATVMPNLKPRPIRSLSNLIEYRAEILRVSRARADGRRYPFSPIMTIELTRQTTPEAIVALHQHLRPLWSVVCKVYPRNGTTNSADGLTVGDFRLPSVRRTLRALEEVNGMLLIHGEVTDPHIDVMDREAKFLPMLEELAGAYPTLRIVLEHASTAAAIEVVERLGDNVAATLTAHHAIVTLNNVIGDGIRPHNMCMPVPKTYRDREAIRRAMTSGDPKFFLGSDSAPHWREAKECAIGACGVFTAPGLPAYLIQVFDEMGAGRDALVRFTSENGCRFYGLPPTEGRIVLRREPYRILNEYDGIVPFQAGETLGWSATVLL